MRWVIIHPLVPPPPASHTQDKLILAADIVQQLLLMAVVVADWLHDVPNYNNYNVTEETDANGELVAKLHNYFASWQ